MLINQPIWEGSVEQYVGQISIFPWGGLPSGWARCDGTILQITANQALYSLLGTAFGGNGTTTFALPDLRGRVILVEDDVTYLRGKAGGAETVTLSSQQLPAHTHTLVGISGNATAINAESNMPATAVPTTGTTAGEPIYAPVVSTGMVNLAGDTVSTVGGAAHQNMQPYLVLNYCIAVEGYYPPRQ